LAISFVLLAVSVSLESYEKYILDKSLHGDLSIEEKILMILDRVMCLITEIPLLILQWIYIFSFLIMRKK
jgi:hypothetical protein